MPPRKSAAKSKSKGKRKVEEQEPAPLPVEGSAEDITMENTNEEQQEEGVAEHPSIAESAQTAIEEVKEIAQSAAGDVMDTAQVIMEQAKEVAHAAVDGVKDVAIAANDFVETMNEGESKTLTMEERMKKMKELRARMRDAEKNNRVELVAESQKTKQTARDVARLDRQRKLAELLRLKAEAEDRGDDFDRQKNWEYTIEENDAWEKRLKRKKTRADFEFHDDAQAAQRKYKKDLDLLKPDLEAYNAQKEAALGYAPGTLTSGASSSSSSALTLNQAGPVTTEQRMAAENLYRDANSLLYADNKPSEEAIDRVVQKLNMDLDKRANRSRKRANEDDGDVTYINERNKVFNKKIARYYDKYTTEIRASFERGTAL